MCEILTSSYIGLYICVNMAKSYSACFCLGLVNCAHLLSNSTCWVVTPLVECVCDSEQLQSSCVLSQRHHKD